MNCHSQKCFGNTISCHPSPSFTLQAPCLLVLWTPSDWWDSADYVGVGDARLWRGVLDFKCWLSLITQESSLSSSVKKIYLQHLASEHEPTLWETVPVLETAPGKSFLCDEQSWFPLLAAYAAAYSPAVDQSPLTSAAWNCLRVHISSTFLPFLLCSFYKQELWIYVEVIWSETLPVFLESYIQLLFGIKTSSIL